MNIIIFDDETSAINVYKKEQILHNESLDRLQGVYLTNLSQFDSICMSSDTLTLLPYNYLGMDLFEIVGLLANRANHAQIDYALKYLCTVADFVVDRIKVDTYIAGRSLPFILADRFDIENDMVNDFSISQIPMYQKNYFSSEKHSEFSTVYTCKMTNVEINHVMKQVADIAVEYVILKQVQIPKLVVGGFLNLFYESEKNYFVTFSVDESLSNDCLFYFGITNMKSIQLHASLFLLFLNFVNIESVTIRNLIVKDEKCNKKLKYDLIITNNIAGWFRHQIVNNIYVNAFFSSKVISSIAVSSIIRAETIKKAMELNNVGFSVSCIGPFEIALIVNKHDLVHVRNRVTESLLYETCV